MTVAILVAALTLDFFLAAATLDPIQILLNAGVIGVVLVLIMFGYLWPRPSVTREFEKADLKDKQQQALIESLLEGQREILPLLTEVDKRLLPLMEGMHQALIRSAALLDCIEKEWEYRERRFRAEEAGPGRPGQHREDDRRGGVSEGPGPGDHRPSEAGS